MKAIGVTLFVTLFIMFAVSIPVHAQKIDYVYPNTEWRISGNIDEMTDEIIFASVSTEYEDGDEFHRFTLRMKCNDIIKIYSLPGDYYRSDNYLFSLNYRLDDKWSRTSFNEIYGYESDTRNLLVRFDKNDAFHTRAKISYGHHIMTLTDTDFLSKIKEHKILLIRFHMEKPNYSIVAKFNISGFNGAYESFRSRFCK